MSFYERPLHYSGVSLSTLDNHFLSLSGINRYPKAFQCIRGTAIVPGLSAQGNERTGLYWPEGFDEVLGATILGWKSFWFRTGSIQIFNKNDQSLTLQLPELTADRVIYLPDKDDTLVVHSDIGHIKDQTFVNQGDAIAPGQPVIAVTGGVQLADLTDDTVPIGLAVTSAASGANVKVRWTGTLELSDWTAVVGSATLVEGAIYVLTGLGTAGLDAGQPVFQAVSPTKVKVSGLGGGGSVSTFSETFIVDGTTPTVFYFTGVKCNPENTEVYINGLRQNPARHVTIYPDRIEINHSTRAGWRIEVKAEES